MLWTFARKCKFVLIWHQLLLIISTFSPRWTTSFSLLPTSFPDLRKARVIFSRGSESCEHVCSTWSQWGGHKTRRIEGVAKVCTTVACGSGEKLQLCPSDFGSLSAEPVQSPDPEWARSFPPAPSTSLSQTPSGLHRDKTNFNLIYSNFWHCRDCKWGWELEFCFLLFFF